MHLIDWFTFWGGLSILEVKLISSLPLIACHINNRIGLVMNRTCYVGGQSPKRPLPAPFLSAEQLKLRIFGENKNTPCSLLKVDPSKFIKSGNSQLPQTFQICLASIWDLEQEIWIRSLTRWRWWSLCEHRRAEVNLHPVGHTWETSILTLWFTLTVHMCSLMGPLRVSLWEGCASFPICFHGKIWQTVEFVSGWSCAHNA